MVDMAPPIQGSDDACWREAIAFYNSRRKKGRASPKYIHYNTRDSDESDAQGHARRLMATAIYSYQMLEMKRGPFANILLRICSVLRQYSGAIDTLVQSNAPIATLVWGSVRALLQIGEEEQRASEIAGEGILEIMRHAARREQVPEICELLGSSRSLRHALVALYVAILGFLQLSTQWLSRGALARLGTSVFNSKRDKIERKLREMRSASDLVDKELQTRATSTVLRSLSEITSDVPTMRNRIDEILQEVKSLSDNTLELRLDIEFFASRQENIGLANRDVLSRLESFSRSIAQSMLDQFKVMNAAGLKQWLTLSAVESSPPVPHTDGTCDWFTRQTSFLQWTYSEESPVLWVQGYGGCGKSVMARYLQEHLTAKGFGTLFFQFQRSASTTQSTPTSFASSLISQLLENAEELALGTGACDQLRTLAKRFPLGPQHCAFKTLWEVTTSLWKMSGSHFSLIIDAMDECLFDNPSVPGVSAFFDSLFSSVREAQSKVVIFTRPGPEFTTAMQSGLSMFMTEDFLLPDIMTFARRHYELLDLPGSEMDEVLEVVRSSSRGSFRWAELFLHHLELSPTTADFQCRMRASIPPSLSHMYQESLLSSARRLSQDELACRRALFLVVFQTQRLLKMAEIVDALSLRPGKAEAIISRLCKPLASTYGGSFHLSHPSVREFFEDYHRTDDRSLGISFSESHGLLAEKCLLSLMNETYADLRRIRNYLVANYDEKASVDAGARFCEGGFYDYAFRYWDYHLVRSRAPSKELLRLANAFILSLQFAYWSERSQQDCGQLVRVNVAFQSLVSWRKGLSKDDQALVELDKYFERPYSLLGAAFASSGMDQVLPWLTRMAMGEYYVIRHLPDGATSTREQVLSGLQRLLGPRHHLTLRAKSGVAYVRLYAGKMRASYRLYNEVLDIQREVLGEESLLFLETLLYKGQSEYFMANFAAAIMTWTTLSAESLRLLGPDSWLYLTARLWYAQGIVYLGQVDLGLQIFRSVLQKRRELFPPGDSFANVVQIYVGETQLLLGRYEESVVTLQDMATWHRNYSSFANLSRLDTEITLAIAYQAIGMRQAAQTIVEKIEEGVSNLRSLFERYCQVTHLKGILLAEGGFINEAIHLLQSVVTQAEDDQENRALLWIRLDLATLLRQRDAEGDREQAAANFDNIVKDISGEYEPGLPDEPDPPRFLATAERALRLMRARKHTEVRHELDAEQLDWRRPSDFWLWVGGVFCKDLLCLRDDFTTHA